MPHAPVLDSILGEPTGQGWKQVLELTAALVLSSLIGLEREVRQKSAGLRTHALVGVGAALFVLVSKYGFTDVLSPGRVVLDPSRVAAQIVTGIGFIGGGLIFVRRDAVRGLTTAAVIWVTAAVGAACGAGLPVLAALVTAMFFLVVLVYPPIVRRLPRSRFAFSVVRVRYVDGRGLLRRILSDATARGFAVAEVATTQDPDSGLVDVTLRVQGAGAVNELATSLADIDGVREVVAGDTNDISE